MKNRQRDRRCQVTKEGGKNRKQCLYLYFVKIVERTEVNEEHNDVFLRYTFFSNKKKVVRK